MFATRSRSSSAAPVTHGATGRSAHEAPRRSPPASRARLHAASLEPRRAADANANADREAYFRSRPAPDPQAISPAGALAGVDAHRRAYFGVSRPGDALERAADRAADSVMSMPDTASAAREAPADARARGAASSSGGRPLDAEIRGFFEPRFGLDLGGVRVHTGARAARSAASIDAHAYTLGSDIVFGEGRFEPHTSSGRRLLAHELSHVAQQRAGGEAIQREAAPAKKVDPAIEAEIKQKPDQGLGVTVPMTGGLLSWLDALEEGEEPETPAAQPAAESDHAATSTLETIKGTPFIAGAGDRYAGETADRKVHINDVSQGGAGDCYFMAILAAVARTRPSIIENMIKDNGDGTYTVTFQTKNGFSGFFGVRSDQKVTVDAKFWVEGAAKTPTYAKTGDADPDPGKPTSKGPELWVMIIEKAFAQLHGGYEKIESGVSWDDAIGSITGKGSDSEKPASLTEDKLFERMKTHFIDKGAPIVFQTPKADALGKKVLTGGAVANHGYVLNKLDTATKKVDLYNPWGEGNAPLLGKDMAFIRATFSNMMFMKLP